ncbi:MAG TPA: methyl-accepting chemotaxis protein [Negativicutes bacterium]|nr:methyl-accepting chemotaxis protein [Negativicutes bacterium]
MKFKKLQTKILAGYIAIVLIFTVIAGVSFFQLQDMKKDIKNLTEVQFAMFKINNKLAFNLSEGASIARAYMLYGKPEYVESFDSLSEENAALQEQLLGMSDTPEEKDMVERSVAWRKLVREGLFEAVAKGIPEEITRIGGEIAPETKALVQINSDMAAQREKDIDELGMKLAQKQSQIILILFTSTGIAVVLAIFLGIILAKSITTPVRKLVGVSERIANGDLDVDVDINSQDEIGALAKAFKNMADNLNEVISNIAAASEQVASGSKQISDSSIALSQGATEQASSIEQLTASVEEIESQTRQNADNAIQANHLAETARTNAAKGNSQMKDMLKSMDEINESSKNISRIIKVIDDIAFQTNILALNAAVEAARAGQHGKGFAVVAEEVRNLAARSANAAKETTAMIEGSISKVAEGTKIANQTAEALNEIVEGISKVANLVGDINVASNEQSAGVSQINQGIMQVSEVVQTNSATSEEAAAASEELAGQAELLKDQVSRFKIKKSRQASSYRGYEDINPEVLKMLEQMNSKRTHEEAEEAPPVKSRKIILSDNEFGKY